MHFQKRLMVGLTIMLALLIIAVRQVAYGAVYTPYAEGDDLAADDAITANELLVFQVDRAVTVADRGFPRDDPPKAAANGNWVSPTNFAEGTFHYRVQIRSQPKAQNMRIQFCAWQDQFVLESCGSQKDIRGDAGTVATWSQPVDDIWKKNGIGVDWRRPRQRYGLAIKNAQGLPVSNFLGWNWNGENPANWYPLDMCTTVVVVAKGATFSGWQNYSCGGGGGNPPATPVPSATPPAATATPTPLPGTPGPTPTITPTRPSECDPVPNNLLKNGSFENNLRPWRFQSNRIGSWSTANAGYECAKAMTINIDRTASNIQLYQSGISLEANTRYRLSFAAYAERGQDLGVYLQKHGQPYTNYGLKVHQVNLQQGWQLYTVDFVTKGFSGTTTDARLRFWMAPFAQPGDRYLLDAVSLVKLDRVTAAQAEGVIVTADGGLLIGLTEAEFDPQLLERIDDGNAINEENELFLPVVIK
jgi:hypothetical protein